MERGEMERNPFSNWIPIVHRDLKLDNIFLDQPSKTRFCRYPTPKIADFGATVSTPKNPPRAKNEYNEAGTEENFPAEQHPTLNDRVVSSKTNVWGVANIIRSLIWKTTGYDKFNFGSAPGEVSVPSFNDDQIRNYSEDLRVLILQCMSYDQDDRPNFPTLLRFIRTAKKAGLDRGLENELCDGGKWTADSILTELKDVVRLTVLQAEFTVD
jgi:serine/threonine protein kinase